MATIKIDLIKPFPRNARKHSQQQIDLIASSIKNWGFRQPIVIDKNKEVIIGHARLEAAKQLGMTEVPVIDADDLTPQQVKALRLADNRLAELAQWDMSLVIEELKGLDTNLVDLTGFDRDLLSDYYEDEFDAEAEYRDLIKPKTKLGELYQLGDCRLLCGDATKEEDVEKLMGGEKADMVFTDPPYGIDYYSPGGLDSQPLKTRRERNVKGDNLGLEEFGKLIEDSFNNLGEFSKNGSPIYICSNYKAFSFFEQQLLKNNFHISAIIIWVKNNTTTPLGTAGDYAHKNEWLIKSKKKSRKAQPIIYGWQEGKHYFSETALEADVWEIKRRAGNTMVHPTQKPLELVGRAIRNSSKRGEIVLDLFGGSGSTLIAAEKEGRRAFLMELDPKYCDIIIKRWENYVGNKAIKIA